MRSARLLTGYMKRINFYLIGPILPWTVPRLREREESDLRYDKYGARVRARLSRCWCCSCARDAHGCGGRSVGRMPGLLGAGAPTGCWRGCRLERSPTASNMAHAIRLGCAEVIPVRRRDDGLRDLVEGRERERGEMRPTIVVGRWRWRAIFNPFGRETEDAVRWMQTFFSACTFFFIRALLKVRLYVFKGMLISGSQHLRWYAKDRYTLAFLNYFY